MSTHVRLASLSEKTAIQNIDQYYLYEFARFMPSYYKLGDDGLFHDDDYSRYWNDEDKYPYLIHHNDEKAGFALVEDCGAERVLAQFFVLYKFQGRGVARSAAFEVFKRHARQWAVHSFLGNPKSEGFWPKVIGEFSEGNFTVALQEPKRTHREYRFVA